MAGTDSTRISTPGPGPVFILVRPQLGENIGAAARAMLNFGLTEMRLVAPRDGWPNPAADSMASGALEVLKAAHVFPDTETALADLHYSIATTARPRGMVKPVAEPTEAVLHLRHSIAAGQRVGVLFGGERAGLSNDDVALADAILTVPTNPAFASINLAQAVLLIGYEWFRARPSAEGGHDGLSAPEVDMASPQRPATREELFGFFGQLEAALDAAGFLYPPEKRPAMVRNIRNIFHRTQLTHQDVQTLRGIVSDLSRLGAEDRP